MIVVQGRVTGRKAGTPKEDGTCFDTLKVESQGREYYVAYDRKLLPRVYKDQEIALACNVSARNNYLNFFANGHIADELLVDLSNYASGNAGKFDDFDF
ncbi:hypothetical protein [Brevibacillus brevis]|uniref:DUF4313 domain-containing protein n=1 Tax=Brevibacillus brevis TaxID=1393 RepID=A0ABY9TCL0_BREBE|nr:hypothetical protein [Brevibacillus brevis]WNC17859.1 hypothetical protein RGB73_30080 [Brevibacillus brevis]